MPDFAEIDGRSLHFQHRGTGRAVVFANSLGTDLRLWDDVISRLPPGTQTLTFDKRGHGLSEAGPVTIKALASDLGALMDLRGIRKAVICGVSVGGLIAQSLANSRPDLVSGMVLLCTGLKIGDAQTWSTRIDAVRAQGIAPLADAILERWFSPDFRNSRGVDLAGYRAMLTRTDAESYARVCEAIRDADMTPVAADISVPVTCLAGDQDQATPPDLVAKLARALPKARFEIIAGVGHLPCIEAPDLVANALQKHMMP